MAENYEANKTAVEQLCKEHPNNVCADCSTPGTRWASVNYGVFVCIRCSGFHRAMGTHISKVKSTNMDKWTAAEVALMKVIGNKKAKELYEDKFPKGTKAMDGSEADSAVTLFLKRKYEDKAFASEDCVHAMKKAYKKAGYKGAKVAKPAAEGKEEGKKSKRGAAKCVEGTFGLVTVDPDHHDEKRAAVLAHFGVEVEGQKPAGEEKEASTAGGAE